MNLNHLKHLNYVIPVKNKIVENNYREKVMNKDQFWDCNMFFRMFIINDIVYEIQIINEVITWVSIKSVIDRNCKNFLEHGEKKNISELLPLKQQVLEKVMEVCN